MTGRLEGKLVIASHNAGKVREIAELLAPHGVEILSAADLGLAEPEETGDTFHANAQLKARAAAEAAGLPVLADDSGLAVTALDGRPGIHSARWAGADRDFRRAMERVAAELAGAADRSARFVSVLALAFPSGVHPGGTCETYEGTVAGSLVWPPRGDRGFGYDPMFVPEGHAITFGEMDPARKVHLSHRAVAFRKLVAAHFGA